VLKKNSPQGAQQQTGRPPLLQLIDGTDGLTDGRTDIGPFLIGYYAGRVGSSRDEASTDKPSEKKTAE